MSDVEQRRSSHSKQQLHHISAITGIDVGPSQAGCQRNNCYRSGDSQPLKAILHCRNPAVFMCRSCFRRSVEKCDIYVNLHQKYITLVPPGKGNFSRIVYF